MCDKPRVLQQTCMALIENHFYSSSSPVADIDQHSHQELCHNKDEMHFYEIKGRHYPYYIGIFSGLEDWMDHNVLFLSCTCLCVLISRNIYC